MNSVHLSTLCSGLFNEDDIKTSVLTYECFKVGSGAALFVHVATKILAGRTDEQKANLSDGILMGLQGLGLEPCSLTVEIIDIDKESYRKKMV